MFVAALVVAVAVGVVVVVGSFVVVGPVVVVVFCFFLYMNTGALNIAITFSTRLIARSHHHIQH